MSYLHLFSNGDPSARILLTRQSQHDLKQNRSVLYSTFLILYRIIVKNKFLFDACLIYNFRLARYNTHHQLDLAKMSGMLLLNILVLIKLKY
jgi:hypothetical protein